MAKDEIMMDQEMEDEAMTDEEVSDVDELAAEEPVGVEAVESAIILKVDDVPELADLIEGDEVTLIIDTINEDGTVGLSLAGVSSQQGASEEAMAGGEGPGGREAVASALQA